MSEIDLSQLPDFIIEATEHLEEMEALLLQLADSPDDLEILNEIFRPVHTIKGSAQFIGVARVSKLTHRLEDLMDKLRDGTMASTPAIVETLIEAKDRITQLCKELENTQEEESEVDDLIAKIVAILNNEPVDDKTKPAEAVTSGVTTEVENTQSSAEGFSEENDEELFSIYLNQVKTQSIIIDKAMTDLESATDKEARLADCIDAINKLSSSANYMGYQEISEFLTGWGDSVKEAHKLIAKDKDVSVAFMDFYFAELKDFFPQIYQQNTTSIPDDIATDSTSNFDQISTPDNIPAIANEDNDDELLSIYINQLQQQATALKSISLTIENSDDKQNLVQRCIDILEKLTSSANYMGYEDVSEFYAGWTDTLKEVAKTFSKGKEISLAFMDFYLAELKQFFPQIDINKTENIETASQPESISHVQPPAIQDETDVSVDELDAALAESVNAELDKDLFGRLTSALSDSIHQVSDAEYETLNSVFDVMVSPKEPDISIPVQAKKDEGSTRRIPGDRRLDDRRMFEERRRQREGKDKKTKRSLRVDSDKIDTLMNQVGELVVDRSYFVQLLNELGDLQSYLKTSLDLDQKELKMMRTFNYRLAEAISGLGRTSNELQEGVMKMRMLPISQIFNRYPRLVHDLTHKSEKKVNLIVNGEETELDKMIVEELSDPLIHIIRNAVDHGIENMDDRRSAGKQPEANLMLNAYQESNNIVIEVTDDGRGINNEKISAKAIEKGLYTADEISRMTPSEVTKIILTAGFSTADKVSNTSGRGVGMDVVRKNIEKLNGSLDIDSKLGVGTRMRIKIPLTLAIIHALMIRTGSDIFAIPLANVDETVRVDVAEISSVEGVEVIYLRGQALPVFRLSTIFGITSDQDSERLYVVIVSSGGQRVGFVVDELMGQDEVVIKPLVDYVQDKSGFSGATIIGDGRISLILDVYEMVRLTAERQSKRQREQTKRLKQKIKVKAKS